MEDYVLTSVEYECMKNSESQLLDKGEMLRLWGREICLIQAYSS